MCANEVDIIDSKNTRCPVAKSIKFIDHDLDDTMDDGRDTQRMHS
jgi:hypothetical protein